MSPCAVEVHVEVVAEGEEGNSQEAQARLALQGLLRTLTSQTPGPGFTFGSMRGPEGDWGMWSSYFVLRLVNGTSSRFYARFVSF